MESFFHTRNYFTNLTKAGLLFQPNLGFLFQFFVVFFPLDSLCGSNTKEEKEIKGKGMLSSQH